MPAALLASLAVLACLIPAGLVAPALGAISSAQTIDGPAEGILEVGGVAMAADGTGGIVYRKIVDGRAHVFAARTANGRWSPAQRLDAGQGFDSSWPRIAAGDDGRLVAVWAQEFGANSDRLFSATLDPGAKRFQAPVPIDLNIGEANATHPSIAMNSGGTAYLAYRVLTSSGSVFPGYVDADVRIARYNGSLWSAVGIGDRNSAVPVATPTAANSPKVGVDVTGNGLVVWQEPDDDFVDRVWGRRLFGSNFGIPLLVSPQTFGGRPLRAPADAFWLDETGFGQGAVAFRQQPAPGGGLAGAHVFVNTIPEAFSDNAGRFDGARIVDGAAGAAPPGPVGTPTVGITPAGDFTAVYGAGSGSYGVSGFSEGVGRPQRLDDGRGAVAGNPAVEVADSGSAVIAWRARTASLAVQERPLAGKARTRSVARADAGPIGEVLVAGSGLGDAVAGFRQGDSAGRIAAAIVNAPPLEFEVQTPASFVRSRRVRIRWDRAPNAIGSVRYLVVVGKRELRTGLSRRSLRVRSRDIGDGRHTVHVVAVDSAGQETDSLPATLKIDRRPPRARITRAGRAVRVRVFDGLRRSTSGLSASRTSISFGDGRRARGKARARHVYRKPGSYRLTIKTRDRAGNRVTLKRRVRVR